MSRRIGLVILAAAALAGGCAGANPPDSPSAVPSATSGPTSSAASATPSTTEAPSGTLPPEATLAAEGGDPVVGQLGTYTWGDGGSDAPWLPGTPMSVGAGEPLTVGLGPDAGETSFTIRLDEAPGDGIDTAPIEPTGDLGSLTFDAPGPGSWSVAIEIEFVQGKAVYFWRLDVS